MKCDDLKLSLYLDGELEDRAEMERHLAGCPNCAARLAQLRGADAELAQAAGRFAPPVSIRVRPRRWWRIPAAAAALLLVGGLSYLAWVNLQEADPQEVNVVAGSLWHSGTRGRARVVVTDYRKSQPVANARVRGRLEIPGRTLSSEAQTGADGSAELAFDLPEEFEGHGSLVVEVSSHLASDVVRGAVRVERSARILLSTDKPVYQPTQTIHVRALAMDNFRLRPLAGTPALLEVEDPNGTKVFKKEGATSAFGIFAADFTLADEVVLGRWRLRARVGAVESERTVEVSRYVLPKFGVTLTTDSTFYAPGDPVKGIVEARYFFPQPVAGGQVSVHGSEQIAGTLDANGRWTFEMRAPDSDFQIETTVVDGAGHAERTVTRIPVSREPILIGVVPVFGEIVRGVENSIYVITTYPDGRPARCRVNDVETDAAGVAVLKLPVREIHARDEAGRRTTLRYDAPEGAMEFALLVEPTARAGETLLVNAFAARDLTLYVDLVKNDQTVLTKTLEVRGGRATLPIDLPTDLSGPIEISAYVIVQGDLIRSRRIVLVDLPGDLRIRPRLSKSEYRPGEEIAIDFEVLDSSGKPAVAAITLGVVDEALFALAEARPGLEREYFQVVQDLLKPRYPVQTSDPRVRASAAQEPRTTRRCCGVSYRQKDWAVVEWANRRNEAARILGAGLLAFLFIGFVIWTFVYSIRESMRGRSGCLIAESLVFVVGFLLLLVLLIGGTTMRKYAAGGRETMTQAPRKDGGRSPAQDTKTDPPRVREWFPETLYWNSEIITDENGRASVKFKGADSITTWRMTMSAVSREGRLGSATDGIRVFQPFFVDLDLPLALTEGDELWVPIAVCNFTDKRDTVTLRFTAEAGIELLEGAEKKLEVEPKQVTSIRYHVRAAKFGTHRLEVRATAADFQDAVARTIAVEPDGKAIPFVAGDRLRRSARFSVVLPQDSIDGAHRAWVRLYPSSFSEVVTGLDRLIRMPYG